MATSRSSRTTFRFTNRLANDPSLLNFRESYTLNVVWGDRRKVKSSAVTNRANGASSFAVNLGKVFDLVNLVPVDGTVVPGGIMQSAKNDLLSDANITSLALDVHASCFKGKSNGVIGAWTQVSRLSHPLVNEAGTPRALSCTPLARAARQHSSGGPSRRRPDGWRSMEVRVRCAPRAHRRACRQAPCCMSPGSNRCAKADRPFVVNLRSHPSLSASTDPIRPQSRSKEYVMWKKAGFLAAAAIATGVLMIGPAVASTPVLDERQENQRDRIAQGVRSGELTRPETRRLVRGQEHLRRMERRAEADGEVTARERARLHREANQQSRRIRRQKHDAQHRG